MGPLLRSLVNLQSIEQKLRTARKKLTQNRQMVLKQQHLIDQFQAAFNAKHEEIKLARLQYGRLELELKTRENGIAKYRVALNNAKTNTTSHPL